ncbi:hypothetical protein M407DRAFT_3245 [Tulasnella calospora MUT 4182]|uniref:Uncharacterized protein n=1 Tax=Tulasnella calospora MUT 4182 TaxID=1051891 RepID=A0A0C3QN31_9AGAM|nr:hypothetical protein M407DRAFT_3245 [Tulasnella calospora MUT 4182]
MAYLEGTQTRKHRAIKNTEVADIYERYLFDVLKAKQDAVDAFSRRMLEVDAQMQANKDRRQELQETVDRHFAEGNRQEAAHGKCEIIDLTIDFWSLMADWLVLSRRRRVIEEKRKDLEWERNQVVGAYWANVEYANALEGEVRQNRSYCFRTLVESKLNEDPAAAHGPSRSGTSASKTFVKGPWYKSTAMLREAKPLKA